MKKLKLVVDSHPSLIRVLEIFTCFHIIANAWHHW